MAGVPFGSLIPQRSRVLPQGGAVLGQLTGTFQAGLEQGRMRAAEEQAPDLLLNYLETQGQGYGGGTLGNLAAPATGYVGGQQAPQFNGMPTQANADLQTALTPGSETFDGRFALRRTNAEQQNQQPPAPTASAISYNFGDGTIRNQPVSSDLERVLNTAAAAAGIDSVVINSGGQAGAGTGGPRTGSTRHDHGGAADLQLVVGGRALDFTNPNDLPIIQSFIAAARANGATGFGAGTDYMGNNTLHVGFGNEAVWGAGGSSATAPEWLSAAVSGGGPSAPMTGGAPSSAMPATGGGYSSQPAWSPPTGAERAQLRALMINPATRQMGYQLAIQRMTPPEPVQPNWQLQEFNGTLYRIDANTGQAQPVIQGQPGATGDPFTLSPGQQRFDAAGNPIAALPAAPEGADGQPSDWELYQLSARQYEAAGQQAPTFDEWDLQRRGRLAGINTADDALRAGLVEGEVQSWGALSQQGTKAAASIADLDLLSELSTIAPSGPVEGRLLQIAGPGFNNAADAFRSIVLRVAPTLRAEGSGATSDIEYQGMVNSLPTLTMTDEARQGIIAMMRAKANLDIERAQIVLRFQNQNRPDALNAEQAREMLAEINSRSIVTPEMRRALGLPDRNAPAATTPPALVPPLPGAPPGAPTATNPATGERVYWNGTEWMAP